MEYLESLDFSDMSAFEYGSGNSTLWWAAQVKSLASVESDSEWYQNIEAELKNSQNVDYLFNSDPCTYVHDVRALQSDIVIIDGDYRAKCAKYLLENLTSFSILIFDNSDWYPKTIAFLNENLRGFIRVDFSGFGPINTYSWTTSIFLNKEISQLNFKKAIGSRAGVDFISVDDNLSN